jgi:hypothetical protein
MLKAYPDIKNTVTFTQLTIQQVLNGYPDQDIAEDVLKFDPQTLTETIEKIIWMESCKHNTRKRQAIRTINIYTNHEESDNETEESLRRINGRQYVTEERLLRYHRDSQKNIELMLQDFANKYFGNKSERKDKRNTESREDQSFNTTPANRKLHISYNCNKDGHLSYDRLQRTRENQKRVSKSEKQNPFKLQGTEPSGRHSVRNVTEQQNTTKEMATTVETGPDIPNTKETDAKEAKDPNCINEETNNNEDTKDMECLQLNLNRVQPVTTITPVKIPELQKMAVTDPTSEEPVYSHHLDNSQMKPDKKTKRHSTVPVASKKIRINAELNVTIGKISFNWPAYVASIQDGIPNDCNMDDKDTTLNMKREIQVDEEWLDSEERILNDDFAINNVSRTMTTPTDSKLIPSCPTTPEQYTNTSEAVYRRSTSRGTEEHRRYALPPNVTNTCCPTAYKIEGKKTKIAQDHRPKFNECDTIPKRAQALQATLLGNDM